MNTEIEPLLAVVDDDESVARSLGRFLRASGFRVVLYPSAEVLLADPQILQFDCLVVDWQLGGMSGSDLQRHLISAHLNIPIVLMTARDGHDLDLPELESDGTILLSKSEPGQVLLASLSRVIHRCPRAEAGRGDA